jgi:alkylation response protein AidB-like acyl-CoA dehydrogenase
MLQNGDVLSLAFAERGSRFDSNLVSMRADRSGADWLLNGEKIFVLNGAEASCFVVSARTSGNPGDAQGVSLFLVPRGSDGLNLQSYAVLDGRRACDLVLRDVRIDDTLRLGALGEGSLPLQRILDRGAVASCAEAIGAMWQALETTVSYLKQRVQFGRPLIQFQALQHRLVDMHIAIREAAVMTRRATNETWADDRARQAATSAAKVMVGRAMRLVGPGCVQLHGAVGTTDECVISHYYKRLSVLEPMFGNTDWHVKRLTKLRSAVGGLVLASAATGH